MHVNRFLKMLYKTDGKVPKKIAKYKVTLSHMATLNYKVDSCAFFFEDPRIMMNWIESLDREFITEPITVHPVEVK